MLASFLRKSGDFVKTCFQSSVFWSFGWRTCDSKSYELRKDGTAAVSAADAEAVFAAGCYCYARRSALVLAVFGQKSVGPVAEFL